MPHGFAGERRPVRDHELAAATPVERRVLRDVADPFHVGGGQHREHARHRLGGFDVDRADVRERMRRAHEIGLQLAGQRRVGRKTPEPAHQRIVLQAGLVGRAVVNGLRIHDGFRCGEGAGVGAGFIALSGAGETGRSAEGCRTRDENI